MLNFDSTISRRPAIPQDYRDPFSNQALNDPNTPSIINNPHLNKNPIFEENQKIFARLLNNGPKQNSHNNQGPNSKT